MTGVFGEGRHFRATLPERRGDSRVVVDDVDITRAVSGFLYQTVEHGRFATVELTLAAVADTEIDSHATNVVLSADSEEMLAAAGWLRPVEAAWALQVVETARAWMRGEAHAVDLQVALEQIGDGGG